MMTLLRRLSYLFRRSRRDADLRDEMETHRTLRQARLEREGLSASEAREASRRALGNHVLAREDARAVWLAPWLESVSQDLRFSARTFARGPLLWSVAVLSLALGIGVNTTAFALYDQLLLRRLPVPAPEELINITATGPRPGSRSTNRAGGLDAIFSHPALAGRV